MKFLTTHSTSRTDYYLSIYNLSEKSDGEIDKKLFAELCKIVFSDEFAVSRIFTLETEMKIRVGPY